VKIKKIILSSLFLLSIFSFFTSNFIHANNKLNVEATQTSRRIYAYLEGGWDSGKVMFIHYWGDGVGNTFNTAVQMTQVINDYYQSMFFIDLPIAATGFLVKDRAFGNGGKNSNQSEDVSISSLFPTNNYKVLEVSAWLGNDSTKRASRIKDNAPMNSGQLAAILSRIDTCSNDYAMGFNAWPQLNTLFISPSTYVGSTVVNDQLNFVTPARDSTTISDKISRLVANYERGSAN